MTVVVAATGVWSCLQDRGRPGWATAGVGRSGAFDLPAAQLANRLVGNDEDAAVIETVGGGLRLRLTAPAVLAVTGAGGPVTLAGRPVGRNAPVAAPAGTDLTVGTPTAGLRSYVAVRGGIAVAPVLGSRSWDSLGRLGPAPLAPADRLPVGPVPAATPVVSHAPVPPMAAADLAVTPGPRADWFTAEAWTTLVRAEWRVLPTSDRVGVRLSGPALPRAAAVAGRELPPEPMVRGAVQVPPDGQPIILGPDHPTTGGYPVLAVVSAPGMARCAQLTPGDTVRLHAILGAGR